MKKIFIVLLALSLSACKKDFLEARPDQALLVPTTLDDLEKILNNDPIMALSPEIHFIASDDYTISAQGLQTISSMEKNSYLWAKDVYEGRAVGDWLYPYTQVYYANVVLETLGQMTPESTTTARYRQLKGSALFYRAAAFYNLAQVFCAPYRAADAAQEPGIPLRLTTDVTARATRATVKATYDQVLSDLEAAAALVPTTNVIYKNLGKSAVLALQARVYLSMADYEKAGQYADAALRINSGLIDYNDLNPADYRPFPVAPSVNKEMLSFSQLGPYAFDYTAYVDPALYASYAAGDLRKAVFFTANTDGTFSFKGTYTGNSPLYGGLATDELYLIRAEAYARMGRLTESVADLNALLVKRWARGSYIPFSSAVQEEILKKILEERRKELIGRGLRWTDLRRLNQEPGRAVTLTRSVGGQTYTLAPNDPRYIFPIPDAEIRYNGLPQNPR